MSLASRMLTRIGFGTGAIATTAIIVGGFALIDGHVNLGTLTGNRQQSDVHPTLADADPAAPGSATPDDTATLTPSTSPTPTAASSPTTTRPVEAGKRTSSTSRSVSARATIAPKASTGGPASSSDSALAQQVLDQINAARKSAGLPALTMSAGLVRSAAAHNAVMSGGCGLAHQCSGEADLGKRISAQGVSWTAAGENIGQGGPEPNSGAAIVAMAKQLTADMLAETPPNDGHRKNILSTSFKHVGIALYRDGKGTVWMTQDFSS